MGYISQIEFFFRLYVLAVTPSSAWPSFHKSWGSVLQFFVETIDKNSQGSPFSLQKGI